jgi:hypothetical protein
MIEPDGRHVFAELNGQGQAHISQPDDSDGAGHGFSLSGGCDAMGNRELRESLQFPWLVAIESIIGFQVSVGPHR